MASGSCKKCEEWGIGFVFLIVSCCTLWVMIGLKFTFMSGVLPTVGFIGLFLISVYSAFWGTCRYCYYYGKRCYCTMGLFVPFFFKKVDTPGPKSYALIWDAIFVITIIYPLIFIFKQYSLGNFLFYSVLYLVSPVTAITLVSKYGCPYCKHTSCQFNPDRIK